MATNRANIASGADTVLYSATNRGCTSFRVDVPLGAGNGILIHVDGLHAADEYIPIPVGGSATFRYYDGQLKRVVAQGDGGTCTGLTYGVVSKTAATS